MLNPKPRHLPDLDLRERGDLNSCRICDQCESRNPDHRRPRDSRFKEEARRSEHHKSARVLELRRASNAVKTSVAMQYLPFAPSSNDHRDLRADFRIALNRTTIAPSPSGEIAREGIAAMAGLRDRPLMRDALLAGGVIAASAVAALIALDPGAVPRPHFGFVASISEHADSAGSASGAVKSKATSHAVHAVPAASALPKQIGFGPPSKETKAGDTPLVMMVPDLPHQNSESPPPSGVWNDQGSAAPVNGSNSQPPPAIAMSAVGGISAPPISPTGSLPSAPASSTNLTSPSNPVAPPTQPSVAPHPGFVLLSGGQGNGQFALASAELFDPASSAFAAASSMKDARADHTATALPSGKILIAGGEGASGTRAIVG